MNLAVLILAAGQSRRFNGIKQIARVHQTPLIQYQINKLIQLQLPIFIVLGANAGKITPYLTHYDRLEPVYNDDWQTGIGGSIAKGVQALAQSSNRFDGVLIQPLDQIAISLASYKTLIALHRTKPNYITSAYYQNIFGCPTVFPMRYFEHLKQLTGDRGAANLIQKAEKINSIELSSATIDVDTRADLVAYHNLYLTKVK
ncbi:nucleotidyltransferase family protein [Gayadomonas joobiniege]|uniref:nucleotidyltransferase family protein n=1 Tax=Gayadomonas joobiniege TaxID=1234606 RepID=UPI00037BFE2D|nr:nucleotidyltransferase family protein [Gayadomonas joobiniege]